MRNMQARSPTWTGWASTSRQIFSTMFLLMVLPDPERQMAMARAYNRWIASTAAAPTRSGCAGRADRAAMVDSAPSCAAPGRGRAVGVMIRVRGRQRARRCALRPDLRHGQRTRHADLRVHAGNGSPSFGKISFTLRPNVVGGSGNASCWLGGCRSASRSCGSFLETARSGVPFALNRCTGASRRGSSTASCPTARCDARDLRCGRGVRKPRDDAGGARPRQPAARHRLRPQHRHPADAGAQPDPQASGPGRGQGRARSSPITRCGSTGSRIRRSGSRLRRRAASTAAGNTRSRSRPAGHCAATARRAVAVHRPRGLITSTGAATCGSHSVVVHVPRHLEQAAVVRPAESEDRVCKIVRRLRERHALRPPRHPLRPFGAGGCHRAGRGHRWRLPASRAVGRRRHRCAQQHDLRTRSG